MVNGYLAARILKRLWVVVAVVLSAAGVAGGQITASLEVAAGQDASGGPYRQAELTVENSAAAAVADVLLRPDGGGPAVRYGFAVPPGQGGKMQVALPAIWPVQQYSLTARDDSGKVLGRAAAAITWPAELVATDAFIDDAFRPWADDLARWPAKTRREYLWFLTLFAVAAAGTLFIPRPVLRACAVILVTAGAALLLVFIYTPTSPVLQVHGYTLFLHDGLGECRSDSFSVLSSRRTAPQQSAPTSPLPYPVYPDRAAAGGGDAVVDPAARTIRLTIRPGQVRIIRPTWRRPDEALIMINQISPPFPLPTRRGSVRREADGFIIETNFNLARDWVLMIHDDSVFLLLGADLIQSDVSVPTELAQSYWEFMGDEGGDYDALNRHACRLLEYWRNKHQRAGEFYLLEPRGDDDGACIDVLKLKQVPAGATTTSISVARPSRP